MTLLSSTASAPLYHAFILHTLDAICIYDAGTKQILETNLAFRELLGYTEEEAARLTIGDVVMEGRLNLTGYFHEIIVAGRGSRTERCWRKKDGTFLEVQVTASLLRHGEQDLVFVVARDITERRQAEQRMTELLSALQASQKQLTQSYEATLEGLAVMLELRDKETQGHTRRVTELTLRLARALDVPEDNLVHIRRGSLLHDIGKIAIPDNILHKAGPFTADEQEVMSRHPTYAYEMISAIPFLFPAIDIPYCHHEKWDGSGYPRGLSDEAIPMAARMFAVVDVWDALSSDRPYRKSWPRDQVVDYVRAASGTHFDPEVVQVFLAMMTETTHPLV